jgi:hypothetical protein
MKCYDIQIDREVTVSNFQVISKLLDFDNVDDDESAFSDRDVALEDISNCS